MNIVPFRRKFGGWDGVELNALRSAAGDALRAGGGGAWEIGVTEKGDPQLYVLGPEPQRECLLCVSRLGRMYVLEDGEGRILYEHDGLNLLAEQMREALRHKKGAIAARLAVAWFAIRETFEERIEPVLAEPMELFSLVAPKLVALV